LLTVTLRTYAHGQVKRPYEARLLAKRIRQGRCQPHPPVAYQAFCL